MEIDKELADYMSIYDYREGFIAGENHTIFWLRQFAREGLTLEEAIAKYEGDIKDE